MIDLFVFVLLMLFFAFVPMYVALIQGAGVTVVYTAALSGAVIGAVLLFARKAVIGFLSRRRGTITTAVLVLYAVLLVAATISELLGLGWFRVLSF
jgi:hypothetical protein